ncbi:MAG: hypothetical protein ACRYFS_05495 [Janthinobacterium lividum]
MSRRMNILSPEDVAEELQFTKEQVIAELEAGTLTGFKFAGEWRTTEQSVVAMIEALSKQSVTSSIKEATASTSIPEDVDNQNQKGIPTLKQLTALRWNQTTFEHFWPTETEPEVYEEAYQVKVQVKGKEVPLLICFCDREAAGMVKRRRAVVFWGDKTRSVYPLVEFVGANDFSATATMASVIRADARKQCRADQPLPIGYEDMPVSIYNNIVSGPYASGSRCVVAQNTDFAIMARHALLRAEQKGFI